MVVNPVAMICMRVKVLNPGILSSKPELLPAPIMHILKVSWSRAKYLVFGTNMMKSSMANSRSSRTRVLDLVDEIHITASFLHRDHHDIVQCRACSVRNVADDGRNQGSIRDLVLPSSLCCRYAAIAWRDIPTSDWGTYLFRLCIDMTAAWSSPPVGDDQHQLVAPWYPPLAVVQVHVEYHEATGSGTMSCASTSRIAVMCQGSR